MAKTVHLCDNARSGGLKYGIFEGSQMLIFIGSFGLGVVIMVLMDQIGFSVAEALIAAAIPVVAAIIYTVVFKRGKPPSYDIEALTWFYFCISCKLASWRWIKHRPVFAPANKYPASPIEELV